MKAYFQKLMAFFATKKPKAPEIRIPVHCPNCDEVSWLHETESQPFDTECECGAAFTVSVNGEKATTNLLQETGCMDYAQELEVVRFEKAKKGKSWIIEAQGQKVESMDICSIKTAKNGRSLKLEIGLRQLHTGKEAPYEIHLHYPSIYQCDAQRERIVMSFQCSRCVNAKCPATEAPSTECKYLIR